MAQGQGACCTFDEQTRAHLLEKGRLVSPSSRTGQDLVIGAEWLMTQIVSPKAHDVLGCARNLRCPLLAIHGEQDITVSSDCAHRLASEAPNGRSVIVAGGDHVFNTPNPADPSAAISPQLRDAIAALVEFIEFTALSGASERD